MAATSPGRRLWTNAPPSTYSKKTTQHATFLAPAATHRSCRPPPLRALHPRRANWLRVCPLSARLPKARLAFLDQCRGPRMSQGPASLQALRPEAVIEPSPFPGRTDADKCRLRLPRLQGLAKHKKQAARCDETGLRDGSPIQNLISELCKDNSIQRRFKTAQHRATRPPLLPASLPFRQETSLHPTPPYSPSLRL